MNMSIQRPVGKVKSGVGPMSYKYLGICGRCYVDVVQGSTMQMVGTNKRLVHQCNDIKSQLIYDQEKTSRLEVRRFLEHPRLAHAYDRLIHRSYQ